MRGVVILGAGPTGLGCGRRLAERGCDAWRIYERRHRVGGHSASWTDEEGYRWDEGVHVIFSRFATYNELVAGSLGGRVRRLRRRAVVRLGDDWVPYPFQQHLHHLPEPLLVECVEGLLDAAARGPVEGPDVDFATFQDRRFGRGINRLFMRPYNEKVWAHPLEDMSSGWIADRVAPPEDPRSFLDRPRSDASEDWGPNSTFLYPEEGGIGALWEAVAEPIASHIECGRRAVSIDTRTRHIRFEDGALVPYERLVSSLPLPDLARMCGLDAELPEAVAGLCHSWGHVVGVGLAGEVPDELRTSSWIYLPDPGVPCSRVTVLSNYSPAMAPSGRWSLVAEISHSAHRPVPRQGLERAVVDGLAASGLIDRGRVRHVTVRSVEHFYPIPTLDRDRHLAALQARLEDMGILSRGRFGAWRYEAGNMDHSFMQGVEAADRVLDGEP